MSTALHVSVYSWSDGWQIVRDGAVRSAAMFMLLDERGHPQSWVSIETVDDLSRARTENDEWPGHPTSSRRVQQYLERWIPFVLDLLLDEDDILGRWGEAAHLPFWLPTQVFERAADPVVHAQIDDVATYGEGEHHELTQSFLEHVFEGFVVTEAGIQVGPDPAMTITPVYWADEGWLISVSDPRRGHDVIRDHGGPLHEALAQAWLVDHGYFRSDAEKEAWLASMTWGDSPLPSDFQEPYDDLGIASPLLWPTSRFMAWWKGMMG